MYLHLICHMVIIKIKIHVAFVRRGIVELQEYKWEANPHLMNILNCTVVAQPLSII